MNALSLSPAAAALELVTQGRPAEPSSFRFWFKAGAGFTLGAGAVYVAAQIVWLVVITEFPMLWFLHGLTRF